MLAYVFDFSLTGGQNLINQNSCVVLCQHLIIYSSLILSLSILVTVILNITSTKFQKFTVIYTFSKLISFLIVSILFILIFIKFLASIFFFRLYAVSISTLAANTVQLKYLIPGVIFTLNSSILSDIVLLLAFSSGMVCVYLLGEKNLAKYVSNSSIFVFFYLSLIVMVYTTNLLVMFIGFEFLFLPTLFFVYKHGYVQRTDKTLKVLLYWTLSGAFLVLSSLTYMYYKYKTLNFYTLSNTTFTDNENFYLYIAIFLGFGVKVPIFPFHYWLTKIHVEAPAGFSIFLSGFLVKAAIYCFYFFNLIFQSQLSLQLVTAVALFGVAESSIKMWNQTDFKKLIAFATIQEMNLILFLLVNLQNTVNYSLILFILIHGWLSTLMFYMVDVIQKKTQTRNIVALSGLAYVFPTMKFIMWLVIILFSGFPLTVKFSIEWQILALLTMQSQYVTMVIFFIVLVIGTIGFVKQMFIILYGMPRKGFTVNNQLSRRDKYLFYFISALLIFLNVIHFFLG